MSKMKRRKKGETEDIDSILRKKRKFDVDTPKVVVAIASAVAGLRQSNDRE